MGKWITKRTIFEFDTMIPAAFHVAVMCVQCKEQIYREVNDFDWLCLYSVNSAKGL
jgi:hypothetical protein